MAHKYTQMCLTSPVIREIQILQRVNVRHQILLLVVLNSLLEYCLIPPTPLVLETGLCGCKWSASESCRGLPEHPAHPLITTPVRADEWGSGLSFRGSRQPTPADCPIAPILWWPCPLWTSRENYDLPFFSTTWKSLKWVRWKLAAEIMEILGRSAISQVILFLSSLWQWVSKELGTIYWLIGQLSYASNFNFVTAWHYHTVL